MTDTTHNDPKELYEATLNRVLVCDGVALGQASITRHDPGVAHDDGTWTGASGSTTFEPSDECRQAIALLKAAAPSPAQADFSVDVDDDGCTVHITDRSVNAVSESWDMDGNGAVDDTSMGDRDYTYTASGDYTIRLTALGAGGDSSTCEQTVHIVVPTTTPVPPPSTDLAGKPVTITTKLPDGTINTMTAQPNQRIRLFPGTLLGSLRYTPDGKSINIENGYMGLAGDLEGHFTLECDGTTLFDGDLTIWAYKRTRPFWLTTPTLRESIDLALFPAFGPGSEGATCGWYVNADNGPMGIGIASVNTNNAGEHGDLGQLPIWDAIWMVNRTPENLEAVFGMADAAAPMMGCVIDPATEEMVDMSDNPTITLAWQNLGGKNPITPYSTSNPNKAGSAEHATNYNSLACALRDTDYDREQLAFNTIYVNSLTTSWPYRMDCGCIGFGGAPRAIGRGGTLLMYAAKYAPDRWKPMFDTWSKALLDDGLRKVRAQTGMHIIQGSGTFAYNYSNTNLRGYAPWQQDICDYLPGLAVDCGYAEAQELVDYFAVWAFGALLDAQPELATYYSLAGLRHPRDAEQADMQTATNDAIDATPIKSVSAYIDALIAFVRAGSYTATTKDVLPPILRDAVKRATNFGQKPLDPEAVRTTALAAIPDSGVPVDDWVDGLNATAVYNARMAAALPCPSGSQALQDALGNQASAGYQPGDFCGYPTSGTGYAAMKQPGLASLVQHATDTARADAAWAAFQAHQRINFSNKPKYNQWPKRMMPRRAA